MRTNQLKYAEEVSRIMTKNNRNMLKKLEELIKTNRNMEDISRILKKNEKKYENKSVEIC